MTHSLLPSQASVAYLQRSKEHVTDLANGARRWQAVVSLQLTHTSVCLSSVSCELTRFELDQGLAYIQHTPLTGLFVGKYMLNHVTLTEPWLVFRFAAQHNFAMHTEFTLAGP